MQPKFRRLRGLRPRQQGKFATGRDPHPRVLAGEVAIGRSGGRFETNLKPNSDVELAVLVNARVGFGWTPGLPEPRPHHRLENRLLNDPRTAGHDPPEDESEVV